MLKRHRDRGSGDGTGIASRLTCLCLRRALRGRGAYGQNGWQLANENFKVDSLLGCCGFVERAAPQETCCAAQPLESHAEGKTKSNGSQAAKTLQYRRKISGLLDLNSCVRCLAYK